MLIVRGDLRSETGWSKATRALIDAIGEDFKPIIGVDIHFHPDRSRTPAAIPIMSDHDAMLLARQVKDCIVLNACLPGEALRYPAAINLIWWFWETDKLPRVSDWTARLGAMDAIMVPSSWQANWLKDRYTSKPVFVVPWPHHIECRSEKNPRALRSLELHRCLTAHGRASLNAIGTSFPLRPTRKGRDRVRLRSVNRHLASLRLPFDRMLQEYDGYFFAAQTDAPRKGLPILINEWCAYRRQTTLNRALVVKFSTLDVFTAADKVVQRFREIIETAARNDQAPIEHVYALIGTQDEDELHQLYANAVAFVSPTLGEGFGGTIVEAAIANTPPIVARHTACTSLIPADYPYALRSTSYTGRLAGQLAIQPDNGSWHPPAPGEISRAMLRVDKSNETSGDSALTALQRHLASLLSPSSARAAVREAISVAISIGAPQ